ncbi:MAG TPA: CDP-alcohol phosphatidyltransferase family protein [Thermoanaerobaculia bacterium]|nr:CDP-alcohol phosphatidyltransferase family protein [Thermoanaerobaculia bacterium]
MPTVYSVKPAFVRLLSPAIDLCARRGVTPNALTGLALALSLAGGVALLLAPASQAALVAVALLLLVRMALNAMDGALARKTGQSSRGGEVFNEASDVVADAALYAPLVLVTSAPAALVFAFVLFSGWTELAGVLPRVTGGPRRYDGPLGKSDRALVVGLLLVSLALGAPHDDWETWLLALLSLLLLATCARRLGNGLAAPAGSAP